MFVDFRGDFDRLPLKDKVIRMLEEEFGHGRYYDEFAQDLIDTLGVEDVH